MLSNNNANACGNVPIDCYHLLRDFHDKLKAVMTGRTHDLAGFTVLSYVVFTNPVPQMSLATAIMALGATFIGSLAPDIDQPTADLYRRLPVGSVIGRIMAPFFGGHRYISHSLLGIIIFGVGLRYLLSMVSSIVLVDMVIVWGAFMIGFTTHLVADMFTKEGVAWLFPVPIHFGIPPFALLRVKTGGGIEKSVFFPALLVANVWLYYTHYEVALYFLRNTIHR